MRRYLFLAQLPHLLRDMWRVSSEKNLGLIAAGVAFFAMLALFPGLAAVVALFGLFADPGVVHAELALLRPLLPQDVFVLVEVQVLGLISAGRLTLGWASALSVGVSLWSARAGVGALISGLNAIHGCSGRGGWRHYVMALGLTVALIGVALVALAAVVVMPVVLAFLRLGAFEAQLVELIRWGAAVGLLLAALIIVYRFGPNRPLGALAPVPPGPVVPGAILAVVFWAAGSAGFSLYLANFGTYNQIYGSIGAVIALLMWLYLSAWLVLLGALLNVRIGALRAG